MTPQASSISLSNDYFVQLINALGWEPETRIYMLWAYLDSSAASIQPHRYIVGGGVATCETWQKIKVLWDERLQSMRNPTPIARFDHQQFKQACTGAAKEGDPFYGWDLTQLNLLLKDLATIICVHEVHYLCASVPVVSDKELVRTSYMEAIETILKRSEKISGLIDLPEKISLMFSMRSELPETHIQKLFQTLQKNHPSMEYCVIANADREIPLQAAGLIVSEMSQSRKVRQGVDSKTRAPFMTDIMSCLTKQPPFHQMIEWHVSDDFKAPTD
jgi:hypothetical protein